jgi:hypothetical protein
MQLFISIRAITTTVHLLRNVLLMCLAGFVIPIGITTEESVLRRAKSTPQSMSKSAQCATAEVQPPRTKLPRKTPPSTDMKYPTFMVMTANMLRLKLAFDVSQPVRRHKALTASS